MPDKTPTKNRPTSDEGTDPSRQAATAEGSSGGSAAAGVGSPGGIRPDLVRRILEIVDRKPRPKQLAMIGWHTSRDQWGRSVRRVVFQVGDSVEYATAQPGKGRITGFTRACWVTVKPEGGRARAMLLVSVRHDTPSNQSRHICPVCTGALATCSCRSGRVLEVTR